MTKSGGSAVRFNREYFGYIAGYPQGDIVLTTPEAGPFLERGASLKEVEPYLLDELDVPFGFHLQTPPLVWIELTRRCNLNCEHCYILGGDARDNELSTSEFLHLIDELADMGVWAVALTGGEPTMHSGFVEIVKRARERDLLVGVATNGMFLTRKLLDSLPREGVIISVSLDDLHVPGGRGNKDFDLATAAILRSQEMGFNTNLMTNTHTKNIGKLEHLLSWAKENGVSVRSVPFSPLGRGKAVADKLTNTVEDVELAARFWLDECQWELEYHQKVGLCVGSIFNYGLSLAYMTQRCSSGRYLAYICADGQVYPCTMCAAEKILSPGNMRLGGFSALWRSEWEIRKYSWDNFSDTCEGCILNSAEYYCASRCPAMSHARNQKLFGCGASDYEIASTVVRTSMMEASPLASIAGIPLVRSKDRG